MALDGTFFVQQQGILLDEGHILAKYAKSNTSNTVQQNYRPTSNIYISLKKNIYLIYNALCFEKYLFVGLLDCWTLFSENYFSIFVYMFFLLNLGGAGDLILHI